MLVAGIVEKHGRSSDRTQPFNPSTPDECRTIREELERILTSPHFQNSKRYPSLLRYVVDQVLKGNTDLKERTLGIEVFGRPATYDSNADPVVRVTAGEVRKRLAQYYHELETAPPYEIEIPPGTYVPEFRRRVPEPQPDTATQSTFALSGTSQLDEAAKSDHLATGTTKTRWIYAVVALALILSATWVGRRFLFGTPTMMQKFWGPVLHSPGLALLCIGDQETFNQQYPAVAQQYGFSAGSSDPTVTSHLAVRDHVFMPDVDVLMKVASSLQTMGKEYRVTSSSLANLSDLREGPVVLIGAHNNRWTVRLTQGLRFYTQLDDSGGHILDRQNPAQKSWTLPFQTQYSKLSEDYALIARIKDPTTDRPIIIVAGLASQGTLAAGEFVSTPEYLEQLLKNAPANWPDKNLEAVIQTQVIEGKTGPPRVLAVHFW